MMLLNDVFERFAQGDYTLAHGSGPRWNTHFSPRFLDEFFEKAAERQYTRDAPLLLGR